MIKRNTHFTRLPGSYLFRQIGALRDAFLEKNPQAQLISLGIGDTTQPLPPSVSYSMQQAALQLSTDKGYSGYGPEQGMQLLREKIAGTIYHHAIEPEEVFVSDGAKCDIGRLQLLFGPGRSIAVQDPSYPVYIEGSLLQGAEKIIPWECSAKNHFFPDLNKSMRADIIYFCSPNNPTGAVSTHEELDKLVRFAKKERSLIVFDAAYSGFIQNSQLPRSIYEIEGAKEVAIEVNSFSKLAGFTGVRLGWTVVPKALKYEEGSSLRDDWNRLTTTLFNGASNIAQYGGLAALEEPGLQASQAVIRFYLENVALLKEALLGKGFEPFGGDSAPYLWVLGKGKSSWDLFQSFLDDLHLIVTPGVGFGLHGEGFIRMSAFNSREKILIATERLRNYLF